jgi:hypothetical protein
MLKADAGRHAKQLEAAREEAGNVRVRSGRAHHQCVFILTSRQL